MTKNEEFETIIVDEFVRLTLELYYPRVAGTKYDNNVEGEFERLKDRIKLEYLKDLVQMISKIDSKKLSMRASELIQKKTNIW